MDGHAVLRWFQPMLGAALMVFVLVDVFPTVQWARVGTGILSHRLECLTRRPFRSGSKLFGRRRPLVLSLSGPVILVLLIAVRILLFMLGSAMIIHSHGIWGSASLRNRLGEKSFGRAVKTAATAANHPPCCSRSAPKAHSRRRRLR